MLKILIVASILSVIVEYQEGGLEGGGWISGASIICTFLTVTIVSSISAYKCQAKIIGLEQEAQKK